MEESGRINVTMTVGEYELFKEAKRRAAFENRLISDNERKFIGRRLRERCKGYVIKQAFTSMAYPQSNDQAEFTNQEILRVLRAWLDHAGGSWVDELPSVLSALRTTLKETTDITSFHLVYSGEAVVPVEVRVESDRV
ncbi:uncharacterized protein LOC121977272 [Zingiber officinale]|uniref:uncharacterized protein LOC121977272 n=1 Tax=Zingiber officinale TaxID=94328 RepID=UPI001C4CA1F3|nr:uncharacterized protein LOC121977272 [Zingiber officinale]